MLETLGNCAFQAAAPHLWNELPLQRCTIQSLETFENSMKTFLFRQFFEKRILICNIIIRLLYFLSDLRLTILIFHRYFNNRFIVLLICICKYRYRSNKLLLLLLLIRIHHKLEISFYKID